MAQHDRFPNIVSLALLPFLFMAPLAAEAAVGEITGVTAPSTATQGIKVIITVQGTGQCGEFELDFGDNMSQKFYGVTLPVSTEHTYTSAGSKTIAANKKKNCQGNASATLMVKAPPAGR